MEIIVEGTKIKLTADQVAKIEKERESRNYAYNSFDKTLKLFGFKSEGKGAWSHENEWWAEIVDHGAWKSLWMVGKGLKDSGMFPGGWIYDDPESAGEELSHVLSKCDQLLETIKKC